MDEPLFLARGDLSKFFADLERLADQFVGEIPEDELLGQPVEVHVHSLLGRLMPHAPSLLSDRSVVRRETRPSGSCLEFRIPFGGTGALLEYMPSGGTEKPPLGMISGVLVLTVSMGEKTAAAIEAEFSERVESIEEWLRYLRDDLVLFEAVLSARLRSRIDARRTIVRNERQVLDDLAQRWDVQSS